MEAWEQTDVVWYKEWWTAVDERTCTMCNELHGRKISLWDDFFKKWDKDNWWNKIDYEDIKWPARHTNCRCDLVPILKD